MSEFEPVPTPERIEKHTRSWIARDRLTDDIWRGVLAEYFKTVYTGYEPTEDDFLMLSVESIEPGSGLRIGSRFGVHSKLEILGDYTDKPVVSFDFYANADLTDAQKQEADLVKKTFQENVDQLLQSTGQAEPLEQ